MATILLHEVAFSLPFILAIISILEDQSVPKIFVGDPHQQIYSFKGASNALEKINFTHSYYLTQVTCYGVLSRTWVTIVGVHERAVVMETSRSGLVPALVTSLPAYWM